MKQRLLLIFLVLQVTGRLAGQAFHENDFDHYTTASGLSHNTITGISQDSTGYVWITTFHGLNRFNGSRFVQYHSSSDSNSIASEDLTGMSWLDRHRLAITTAGLHIVDTRTGNTRNLFIPYHDRQYQYKFNMIMMAMGDEGGNTYIVSRSGFYHYDKDYRLVSRFDFYKGEDVKFSHFYFGRELFVLDKNRLMMVGIDGLYMYDKQKKCVSKMKPEDCPLMAGFFSYPARPYIFFQHKPGNFFVMRWGSDSLIYINTIEHKKVVSQLPFRVQTTEPEFHYRSRLMAVNDTLLYITGHYAGFYKMRFYPESGAVKFYPEKHFSSYLCTALLQDKDNHLWIGTNRGLYRQNPRRSEVQVAGLPAGIELTYPDIKVDDIFVSDDKVYAAGRGHGGLFQFDKKTFRLDKRFLFKDNNSDVNSIRAIMPAGHSNLLLGTSGSLLLFNQFTKQEKVLRPPQWIEGASWTSDLYKDRKGNVWIGSENVYRYDPLTESFAVIRHLPLLLTIPGIEEDTAGNIWLAGHGLARYNTRLDSFDLVLDSFPYIKMPDKQVNAFAIDGQNTVWLNSNNNGLIGYNIARKSFRLFTRSNGLPDDNITSLAVVGNQLWIASLSGIACMDLQTFRIVSFGKEDGFPDMPVIKGARFFYDKDQRQLYIGFAMSVVRFNPEAILRKNPPPQTFIETLVINGKKVDGLPGKNITTSWQNTDIRITIGTINFSDGPAQRFAYRVVKNNHAAWIPIGSQPSFSISSLLPGTHRIQVKTYAPNNRWPEQVNEISIRVLPPIWLQDWFIVLMGWMVLVMLYVFIKWRTGLARKKEMEKTHLEKLKADDYKNQFELEQISNYFSSSLSDKKTEEEVLWDVTNNLIGRMNYEDCMIYLWNNEKTKMVQKAAYGPKGKPEAIVDNVFDVLPGQGIVGHVIQSRQPILLNDTRKDSRYRVDDQFRLSEVTVPIIHDNELLGVLDSEHSQLNYFSERDIKILTTIATLIGNKLKQLESEQSLAAKQKELASINEQLAEARLSALQAQMNPHFVFNALNSIKRMILDEDNTRASRYLSKFALMIRMTLEHSKEIFVTLQENIEYLKAYLDMEQLRFDDSFTYSITTDKNVDAAETSIPSMMIQPLVENAIWHGLMQAEADKKITIQFAQPHNKIVCTVEDNGIGIRRSEKLREKNRPFHRSVGLENLQKRIKIMNEKYNLDCSLGIIDLQEVDEHSHGTRVVLQFNVINL